MSTDTGYGHFTARVRPPHAPLTHPEACAALWTSLRRHFPDTLAAILMPNHLHLLTRTPNPETTRRTLAYVLRAWTRRFYPGKALWEPISTPERAPDERYLKRLIRYIVLNPCRAGLARDPLEWEWSTHQDVLGCVRDPWPDLEKLSRLFRTTRARVGETVHEYVSKDPTVHVMGTPPIRPPSDGQLFAASPTHILQTARIITRRAHIAGVRTPTRTLAIQLAKQLQLPAAPEDFGISRATWHRAPPLAANAPDLRAALQILGDQRLLKYVSGSQKG